MRTNPQDNAQHVFYKTIRTFVAVLIWRDTDKMPLKSSETGDRERRMVACQQEMYVHHSQHLAGESQQKLRNTGSKPTFDSIYRYQHRSDIMKLKVS